MSHSMEEEFWGKAGKRKKSSSSKGKNNFPYFLAMLFCVFAFLWVGFKLSFLFPLGVTEARLEPGAEVMPVEEEEKKTKQAILIIGSDKRKNEPSRADTIMVAFLDTEKKNVKILNIPRDTLVTIPAKEIQTKINHAFAYGGINMTKDTVEEFLDIKIDHYMDTDFQGFAKIIDALGGITMDVEKRMYYPEENIDLRAGEQLLNGEQALGYVRYRSDGKGDIGRIERQQKFLHVLADHALRLSTIWKIPKLVDIFQNNVDTDLTLKEMLSLANTFKNVTADSMETHMLPGTPEYIHGVSYWVSDREQVFQMINEFTTDVPEENEQNGQPEQ